MFEVRRCAFSDKPYGVAESYSREGVDMEVNSPRSPEIGLWDSRSNKMGKVKRVRTLRGFVVRRSRVMPAHTAPWRDEVRAEDISYGFLMSEILAESQTTPASAPDLK
ncbi:hypothetical protein PIB30_093120 [Stylosanthes scabra]|uniref:Uncharacterized protein n=1 Tax=Stylosanthes scabra TaxID=79078 RepID=A0ABU6RVL1_9FABA|nr:hypothetical protein [Stylosanthes scabra]